MKKEKQGDDGGTAMDFNEALSASHDLIKVTLRGQQYGGRAGGKMCVMSVCRCVWGGDWQMRRGPRAPHVALHSAAQHPVSHRSAGIPVTRVQAAAAAIILRVYVCDYLCVCASYKLIKIHD